MTKEKIVRKKRIKIGLHGHWQCGDCGQVNHYKRKKCIKCEKPENPPVTADPNHLSFMMKNGDM